MLATSSVFAQQQPASWLNWMGNDHTGVSNESGWSSDWPKDGLPVVWEKEIGIGFDHSLGGGVTLTGMVGVNNADNTVADLGVIFNF